MRNLRIWVLVAAAVAVFGWALPAWAGGPTPGGNRIVTSLLLPLQGIFRHPTDPCVPAGENVALAGEVHAVTKAGPGVIDGIKQEQLNRCCMF